jgi:hypothetical protein
MHALRLMPDDPRPPKDEGVVPKQPTRPGQESVLEAFDTIVSKLPPKWRGLTILAGIGILIFGAGYAVASMDTQEQLQSLMQADRDAITARAELSNKLEGVATRVSGLENRVGIMEEAVSKIADMAERLRRVDREVCQLQASGTEALQDCASR